MIYAFGDCDLDDHLYQLRREGKPIDIEPKVFDVLVYLLHHRDRIIAKDELLDKLWPDQVVSETALTRCSVAARKAREQVRITVRLVDATTGEHLWVELYDRPFADIFALQDEMALST
jgi:DNA-binding winged helix-turn-helix (wHTH) protein